MSSALKVPEPPSTRKPSRNEQLKVVSDEAERIWREHRLGTLSSEQAAQRLSELKRRYSSLFDRILDL